MLDTKNRQLQLHLIEYSHFTLVYVKYLLFQFQRQIRIQSRMKFQTYKMRCGIITRQTAGLYLGCMGLETNLFSSSETVFRFFVQVSNQTKACICTNDRNEPRNRCIKLLPVLTNYIANLARL